MLQADMNSLAAERTADPPGLVLAAVVSLGVIALAVVLGTVLPLPPSSPIRELLLLGVPLAFGICYAAWRYERFWILLGLLGHALMFTTRHIGVGVQEMMFAVVTLLGLAVWLVNEVAVRRRRIVESGFDVLLIAFMILSTVVSVVANRLHHGETVALGREWLVSFDFLLYFPLKKYARSRSDLLRLFICFGMVAMASGIASFSTYQERLAQAIYVWQIESSRVFANETTAMVMMLLFAVAFATVRRRSMRWICFGLFIAGWAFLIISFSRAAIAAGALALVVTPFLLRGREGARLALGIALAAAIGIGGAFVFRPDMARKVSYMVESRLSTMEHVGKDISLTAREVESRTVLQKYVTRSPMIGYGYGTPFRFRDPISGTTTMHADFIHIGYVKPIYRFGIPIALLFYFLLAYPLLRLLVRRPNRWRQPFLHWVAVAAVASMFGMFIHHLTTDLFATYPGTLNFVLCWVALDWVNRQLKREEEESATRASPGLPPATGELLRA